MKIHYLTYYYNLDGTPFLSLSALPDQEAIEIMRSLCDDTPFGERFKDPEGYLKDRKATEKWARAGFIAKGGKPQDPHPISMVLGESRWMVNNAPDRQKHGEIRLPLDLFSSNDLSFTYPDSMISNWLGQEKPDPYYQPDLHGIIFTLDEILEIVKRRGMPEGRWENNLPGRLAPYIEAQVWNIRLVKEYWVKMRTA